MLLALKTTLLGREDVREREVGIRPYLAVLPPFLLSLFMLAAVFSPHEMARLQKAGEPYFRWIKINVENANPWLQGIACVVILITLTYRGHLFTKARIVRWTEKEGVKLINYSGTWIWNNPWGVNQSEEQSTYTVTVADESGAERTAYVRFGDFWGLDPGRIHVAWEDEQPLARLDRLSKEARKRKNSQAHMKEW
jgi:hypothetical protein